MFVIEYIERAREYAAMADRKSGDEKSRLMRCSEAWLKLAEQEAATACIPFSGASAGTQP